MTDQPSSQYGSRLLVIAAALVIIVQAINQAQSIIALFVWSVFFALLGMPPVLWLERKSVPSLAAVIIVMAATIVLLLILGGVVGASLNTFSDALPYYQKHLQDQVLVLRPLLARRNIVVTDAALLEYLNPGPVIGMAVSALAGLGSVISNIVLVMLTVTFVLLEASSFPIKLRALLGNPHQAFPQFTIFMHDIVRYVVIKTLVSLATGVLITLWLFMLGVESPILWGFLAFLLNFIPNVGSIVASIPAILLALIQFGIGTAIIVAAGYLTVNFILDDIIETRLMGQKLGLSTLVVFLSLLFWGSVLGPVGMVLCVPLTMTLKFACENNEDTLWIAVLLGSGESTRSIPIVSSKAGKQAKYRRAR